MAATMGRKHPAAAELLIYAERQGHLVQRVPDNTSSVEMAHAAASPPPYRHGQTQTFMRFPHATHKMHSSALPSRSLGKKYHERNLKLRTRNFIKNALVPTKPS